MGVGVGSEILMGVGVGNWMQIGGVLLIFYPLIPIIPFISVGCLFLIKGIKNKGNKGK